VPAGSAPPATPAAPTGAPRGSCGGTIVAPLRGKPGSGFGDGRGHDGVDILAPVGTSVRAAACGTVTLAGVQSGYGKIICIRHTTSFSTCYAHLSSFAVARGAHVAVGQLIGRVGMTGRTSGPHLHFETRVDGRPRDPARYLSGSRTIPGATANITTG
jgi:murein DD-endopeptidase MepM/ murein hydrolase activator NlpD